MSFALKLLGIVKNIDENVFPTGKILCIHIRYSSILEEVFLYYFCQNNMCSRNRKYYQIALSLVYKIECWFTIQQLLTRDFPVRVLHTGIGTL